MIRNEFDIVRQKNQEMIKTQSQIASIHDKVVVSLSNFHAKADIIKQKNQKYYNFLEGMNQQSVVLQRYTEELLRNEHNLAIEKTNYEIGLSRAVKALRAEDKKLTNDLAKHRRRIIEICAKKTQLSSVVSSLSQSISTFEVQEINLDKLRDRADKIIARLKNSLSSDPLTIHNTEKEHIQKLIAFTEKESQITQSQIDNYSNQIKTTGRVILKISEKIPILKRVKDLSLKFIAGSSEMIEISKKKNQLKKDISEKKDSLIKISTKIQGIVDHIKDHKRNEFETFVDSKRSLNFSLKIENSYLMVQNQLNEINEQLKILKSTKEAQIIEEQRLQEVFSNVDEELMNINNNNSLLTNKLNHTIEEIQKINTSEVNNEITIENKLKELKNLQKTKQNAVLENAELMAQLNDSNYPMSITYDPSINDEKSQIIKKTEMIQYQIDSMMKSIRRLKNDIDRCQLIKEGMIAQKEKMESDFSNNHNIIKKNRNILWSDLTQTANRSINDVLYSNEISRQINSRELTETISKLLVAIKRKRVTIQIRKDDFSSAKNSLNSYLTTFYENNPTTQQTETLKRSIKFAVMENPLQDRIQTLNFLLENLEDIQINFDQQLSEWKHIIDKEEENEILDNWQIELNRLKEKADDLLIFNQVFGLGP